MQVGELMYWGQRRLMDPGGLYHLWKKKHCNKIRLVEVVYHSG